LKVFSGEFALYQHEGVYVTVRGVIIMHGGNELNLFAKPLFQGKHGVEGDISQIQVFVAVFLPWSGTYDYAVKDGALLRVIDHAVGLLFRECAIIAKERAGDCVAVSVSPVGNVTDSGFCPSPIPFPSFDIISLDNRH
jgi:hypothetical protein